jgi:hypothetical protein
MRFYGRTTVSEFMGDRVVFRNLKPADDTLPSLEMLRVELGIAPGITPRKSEDDYARVIALLLNKTQNLDTPGTEIKRLIFIGDTRMNDSTAFANICRVAGWPGVIFIGSETTEPIKVEQAHLPGGQIMFLSNRWAALSDLDDLGFDRFCEKQGFAIDKSTAVIIDLDKTTIGARGRNAHVIDQVRVQAVRDTVEVFLGEAFQLDRFLEAYDTLKQAEYHPFTADNQDYLAYICLILGSGLVDLKRLVADVQRKKMLSFHQFIDQVEAVKQSLPPSLEKVHHEIYANVLNGDPTPFKPFRYNEYRNTVARMGYLPDTAPVEQMLRDEIVITHEVRQLALKWKEQGALLFGLSDKPDEASIPNPDLLKEGFKPIHQVEMHIIGE